MLFVPVQVQSLRQALEQSQEAQRRLQHSNQVLQARIFRSFLRGRFAEHLPSMFAGAPQGTPECMPFSWRLVAASQI